LQGVGASADVESWRAIPPVPAGAFKVGRWAAFPEESQAAAFRTSGTTGEGRGSHAFETLALVNSAILPQARRFLIPDLPAVRFLFLAPSPAVAPDSSLVHMFAVFREALGAPGSRFLIGAREGEAAGEEVSVALEAASRGGDPVLVAGPAIAFLRVLEAHGSEAWELPRGSRAMVTGGFKGLRGGADPDALAASIASRLGIEIPHQVQEYGMTELSSQYYDERLRRALGLSTTAPSPNGGGAAGSAFVEAPWCRVRVVDPRTGDELPPGEIGALVHVDLANRGSAVAVQTSDLGVRLGPGVFGLRGREPGAEARGCSLAADLWLGAR
jgi:hypothetical protein